MHIDRSITSIAAQRFSLLFLRVSTGFLLIWFGLDKVVKGSAPLLIQRNFEMEAETAGLLGTAAGAGEALIGTFCVIGLWRRVVLPLQAAINGIVAMSVWWAIVDPFRWYITGVDRIVFNSHVFYPTIITFAACVVLIVFRPQDVIAVDTLRRGDMAGSQKRA